MKVLYDYFASLTPQGRTIAGIAALIAVVVLALYAPDALGILAGWVK